MTLRFLIPFLSLACLAKASQPVSLEAAYAAALKRSEALAGQEELLIQAREHVKQAWGALAPGVNGLAYRSWQFSPQGQYSSNTSASPSNQPVLKLTANQPLFRGGREYAGLDLTERLADAQAAARDQAKVQAYTDVAGAFYGVLSAEQDLRNLGQEAKLFDERIKELQQRVSIGRSQSNEVLSVQSAQATLDALVSQVQGAQALARESFAFFSGMDASSPLSDSAEAMPLPPLEELLKRAESRPEVRAAAFRLQSSEANLRLNKGGHWPNLDLNANYYYLPEGVYAPSPATSNGSLWDVQLALSVPIFAGFQTNSRVREAESQLRVASLQLSGLRRGAEHEISAAFLNAQSDQSQIAALLKAVEAAAKNYQEQKSKYRLGLVTNLDVLQAVLSLMDNQRALDKANFSLRQDLARLRAATAQLPSSAPKD
jgi:outer membrane protein